VFINSYKYNVATAEMTQKCTTVKQHFTRRLLSNTFVAWPTLVVKEACPKWLMICSFDNILGSTQSRRTPQMNMGVEFLTIRDCNQQTVIGIGFV